MPTILTGLGKAPRLGASAVALLAALTLGSACLVDADGDGYSAGPPDRTSPRTGDCNDADPAVHPGAADSTVDGIDQDCDGIDGPASDRWGGWTGRQLAATGFFRVEDVDGRWWLVTPEGHPFFSTGVNHITFDGDTDRTTGRMAYRESNLARYGTTEAWKQELLRRYAEWGLNTAGAWSDTGLLGASLPYTVILSLGGGAGRSGPIEDYFAPELEERARQTAASSCAPHASDPNLIGYFVDNEMRWGPDWRQTTFLFDDYLALGPEAAGKRALVEFLRTYHQGDVAQLNALWGTSFASFDEVLGVSSLGKWPGTPEQIKAKEGFLFEAADHFYRVGTAAIRAADPNHLILGERTVGQITHAAVATASAPYIDVYSVNRYEFGPVWTALIQEIDRVLTGVELFVNFDGWFDPFYELTGRPVLHSEFGYRAADSGLPNTWPPMMITVPTQTARAQWFELDAGRSIAARHVVGYHWFEHVDEPMGGRFDGEDCNWGIVNSADDPYSVLVDRMSQVNRWWRLPDRS